MFSIRPIFVVGVVVAVFMVDAARADLISFSGAIAGIAESDDGRSAEQSLSIGFSTAEIDFVGPSDFEEVTAVTHSFQVSPHMFSLNGRIGSSSNGFGKQTNGYIDALVMFSVDQEAGYELNFSKNNGPGQEALVVLTGSDSTTPIFSFDGAGEGGAVTLNPQFVLSPGLVYTLATGFGSSAGGGSEPEENISAYTLNLTVIPEPSTGLLALPGVLAAGRCRVRSA